MNITISLSRFGISKLSKTHLHKMTFSFTYNLFNFDVSTTSLISLEAAST